MHFLNIKQMFPARDPTFWRWHKHLDNLYRQLVDDVEER